MVTDVLVVLISLLAIGFVVKAFSNGVPVDAIESRGSSDEESSDEISRWLSPCPYDRFDLMNIYHGDD